MISRPIVVGVDGSPESAAAAAAGWRLAEGAGVSCHLVHATSDVRSALDLAGTGVSLDDLQGTMLERGRGEIVTLLEDRVPPHILDGLIVRVGRPTAILADVVMQTKAGLVVLGGKHHSTLNRWLGGSTVQHVVRRLAVPLLVTAGDLHPRGRVLVAVDLSYAALPTIAEVPFPVDVGDFARRSREQLEEHIWPTLPVPDHHKVVREGVVLDVIAEEATAWRADVIVVGSHGKGWVDRFIIGSLTEDLLNDLPTGVLVIPVPAPERRERTPLQTLAAATA